MTPLAPVVAEALVPLPPRDAFVAFTAHMGEWWDPVLTTDPVTFTGVDIDPKGEVAMRHGKDRQVWGEVTTWEPGRAYAQRSWLGHAADQPTTLSVRFEEDPAGTRVRLEHGGWTEATVEARERYAPWEDLLTRFAAHAAR